MTEMSTTSTAEWPICDLNNDRGPYPDWGKCPRCGLVMPVWARPLCFLPAPPTPEISSLEDS